MHEGGVDVLDDISEFLLGDEWVEDFRVDVAEGRSKVAHHHPVPSYSDHAGGLEFEACFGDMRVEMGETGVGRAPS